MFTASRKILERKSVKEVLGLSTPDSETSEDTPKNSNTRFRARLSVEKKIPATKNPITKIETTNAGER